MKVISILFLQVSLILVSSPVFAQQPGIDLSPGSGAASNSGTDFVDCIFKDSFEACLSYVEGYPDTDSDGFGDSAIGPTNFCNYIRSGFVDNDQDCNDKSDAMFPGNIESCDGLDNDCDAGTEDGSEDSGLNQSCDGADSDLCEEGTQSCSDGSLICSDNSDGDLDVCDGFDNDCDDLSADGSEDPNIGTACDGIDTDLCEEGTQSCSNGSLSCSDISDNNYDICDGIDNDCDPASADGSEDPTIGTACDGPDADQCEEGLLFCTGGSMSCSDISADNMEICDGIDNNCDGDIDEGCLDMGQSCSTGTQCLSGNCVESVCCDTACDSQDQSCLEINTGEPDGMCSMVLAENTPPWMTNNTSLFCESDCRASFIFVDQLQADDQEDGHSQLTYSIAVLEPNVQFFLDNNPTQTFTQQDIDDGRVSFMVCPAGPGGSTFLFDVFDSQGLGISPQGFIETDGCLSD